MRELIIIIATIALMLFSSCETPDGERTKKEGYSTVEIDSCEYIEISYLLGTQYGYYSLTHKGNCKFCLIRSKK